MEINLHKGYNRLHTLVSGMLVKPWKALGARSSASCPDTLLNNRFGINNARRDYKDKTQNLS